MDCVLAGKFIRVPRLQPFFVGRQASQENGRYAGATPLVPAGRRLVAGYEPRKDLSASSTPPRNSFVNPRRQLPRSFLMLPAMKASASLAVLRVPWPPL